MATYTYNKPGADLSKLQTEILAAGLPVEYINGSGDNVIITMDRSLTPAEVTTLDAVVAAHDGRPRVRRPILDIYNAINALTAAQRTAISNDLYGASQKWASNVGMNAGSMFVLYLLTQLGLSTAQTNAAKTAGAAMYCQDNPTYLVNQTFGGTVTAINVPGDQVES